VDGLDPDLIVDQGNALIIQQADTEEPNDNGEGGVFFFSFEPVIDIYTLTLVDTKANVVIKFGGKDGEVYQKFSTEVLGNDRRIQLC